MLISRQKEARCREYAIILSKFSYSAQYHSQRYTHPGPLCSLAHCTRMHNHNDKHPAQLVYAYKYMYVYMIGLHIYTLYIRGRASV